MEEEEEQSMFDVDPMNKGRSYKNILSKEKVSKHELDEIFG
ncbi:MAG: hypothetical protein ACQEP1_05045 [Nanobdellota archaeon]